MPDIIFVSSTNTLPLAFNFQQILVFCLEIDKKDLNEWKNDKATLIDYVNKLYTYVINRIRNRNVFII